MNNEERIKRIEGAILKITDLLLFHDGRMDDFYKALRESREDFEFKMNALIDAQINNQSEAVN